MEFTLSEGPACRLARKRVDPAGVPLLRQQEQAVRLVPGENTGRTGVRRVRHRLAASNPETQ